ncbi:MAG: DUF302 domain-containing protein [Coriobacteriia bacterium]
MDMDVTITSGKDFDATVQAVLEETAAAAFRVLATHDVSATLAEKGFDRERVTIIEVCNAKHAHAVLAADVRIGLMLPCPIMVYAEGDAVKVTTMRPTAIGGFFPEADLRDVPDEVERAIVGIMERGLNDKVSARTGLHLPSATFGAKNSCSEA